jgi:hypothetical protein
MTPDPIMVSDTGPERELPPAGICSAVCCYAVDIGHQDSKFGMKQQIMLGFELEHRMTQEGDYKDKRFHLTPFAFNATLNEKGNLSKCLVGWYGRGLKPEEMAGLDLTTLVGMPVTLTIIHKDVGGGKVYANIASYAPPMKGVEPMIVEASEVPDWVLEKRAAGTVPGFTKPSLPGGKEEDIPFMRMEPI